MVVKAVKVVGLAGRWRAEHLDRVGTIVTGISPLKDLSTGVSNRQWQYAVPDIQNTLWSTPFLRGKATAVEQLQYKSGNAIFLYIQATTEKRMGLHSLVRPSIGPTTGLYCPEPTKQALHGCYLGLPHRHGLHRGGEGEIVMHKSMSEW